MANKPKRMDQIRQIIKIYGQTGSLKKTVKLTGIARNTVRGYIRRFKLSGLSTQMVETLSDEQLSTVMYGEESAYEDERKSHFRDRIDGWISELRQVGVTRLLLWEEYKSSYPDGYEYSQFCERFRKEVQRRDLTMSLDHNPGEVLMVDFAGSKIAWVDECTGEVHYAQVLVCVMPHSQYTFVIAVDSQCIADFIDAINSAFEYLEGLPKVLLSDNLKSYVTRANRYEPTFTQLCEQMAAHYQIDMQAARVRKPKDKASVENAVTNAYRRVYAPLRHEEFHSLSEINEAFKKQLKTLNERPYQKKSGTRKQIFDTYEKELMSPLPPDLFEIKKLTRAKVQKNYHIILGETNNYYSVHYKYVGQRVDVMYTSSHVEIYLKGQRIAFHHRLQNRDGHRYQTHCDHMPEKHKEWIKSQGFKAADFIQKAEHIGPHTRWAIQYVLRSKIHEEQTYKSCMGIIRLASQYSVDRLEAACLRCKQKVDQVNYRMLSNILSKNLVDPLNDTVDEDTPIPDHTNIRGSEAHQ